MNVAQFAPGNEEEAALSTRRKPVKNSFDVFFSCSKLSNKVVESRAL